ncbi:ATP-binding cassette domain-containing protein [Lichenihabitans sp. Uapishka_5]|uniref:ABC transporter ATP-binding protein n=1 Tax=Lichenihabitans sp. Uapishka_5 TaxID=3037302 RepID=UPI0029E7E0A0|nr:ATP-binding cassette domain-containing protein [Lichenihabitans sp. Uapishka_5]MDX7952850.1 ATP-binding cassette domain-containing protein [Lichenihabitans sp. Uapishka_5]
MSSIPEAASPTGVAVRLERVSRSFGPHAVLKALDLTVAPGQFLAVVGRSGSGKSTLLRLLCGLDQPTGGQVLFDGGPARAGVARLMFQEPRLLPWASVIDNVMVGLRPGTPAAAKAERARAALAAVGLEDRAGDWPTVLSGGQKQRVALARALVSRPGLLLLDEPLGALDALTRLDMQDLLAKAWLDGRMTAVLVTHDVTEAVRLADRILLLEDGNVTLDVTNPAPHPRPAHSAEAAALEARIYDRLLTRGLAA